MRDVAPYFNVSIALIFAHIVYAFSGKLAMPLVLLIVSSPIVDK